MTAVNKHFSVFKVETPDLIFPVLLHLNMQKVIKKIILHPKDSFDPENLHISIHLPGLIDTVWHTSFDYHAEKDTYTLFPNNPPIIIQSLESAPIPQTEKLLKLTIDSVHHFKKVTVAHPFTLPHDMQTLVALAAFVLPTDFRVINFVRMAYNRLGKDRSHFGFPDYTPKEAAGIIYDEITSRADLSYSYEVAPWSLSSKYQVIRDPIRIIQGGSGTCIDLAVFFCGCLEYIRRLPMILGFTAGGPEWHVVAAVKNDDFDLGKETVIFDSQRIKEMVLSGKLTCIDPVDAIRALPFKDTGPSVEKKLIQSSNAFMLDIQAIRDKGIWPLPITDKLIPEPALVFQPTSLQEPDYPSGVPAQLIKDILAGKCTLLLGDVLGSNSANSRQALERHLSTLAQIAEPDLMYACGLLEKEISKEFLHTEVLQLLSNYDRADQKLYNLLKNIPFRSIISFYPDPLLESILGHPSGGFKVMIKDEDLSRLDQEDTYREIFLLAGSALSGEGLILKQEEYKQQRQRLKALGSNIRFHLETNTLLVIGCNLNDLNLQDLYQSCVSTLSPDEIRATYFLGDRKKPNWAINFIHIDATPEKSIRKISRSLGQSAATNTQKPIQSSVISRNAFKYLDYYGPEDADIFFGRESDLQELSRELMATRGKILTLFGRSGVGKTSIIRAGLIPKLIRERILTPLYCRFGQDPEESIINALLQLLEIPEPHPQFRLTEIPGLMHKFKKDSKGLVIIMDQCEEAFIKLGRQILSDFFQSVENLLSYGLISVRFIFVIREDYIGQLANHIKELPDLFLSPRALMELSRKSAEIFFQEAVNISDIEVEPGLIETILSDLSPDVILPSSLQIVCDQMLSRATKKWDLHLYNELGRASTMLNEYLTNTVQNMPAEHVSEVKTVLKALVTSETTKLLLSFSQIKQLTGLPENALHDIIYDLIHSHRLVREIKGEIVRFELSHESLANSISKWMDLEDFKFRRLQEMLSQEISDVIKNPDYRFPSDKLKLILANKNRLAFDEDATFVLIRMDRSLLDEPFWLNKLSILPFGMILELLYDTPPDISLPEAAITFLQRYNGFYEKTNYLLPEEIKEEIIRLIHLDFEFEEYLLEDLGYKNDFHIAALKILGNDANWNYRIWLLLLSWSNAELVFVDNSVITGLLGRQLITSPKLNQELSHLELPDAVNDWLDANSLHLIDHPELGSPSLLKILVRRNVLESALPIIMEKDLSVQMAFFSGLSAKSADWGLTLSGQEKYLLPELLLSDDHEPDAYQSLPWTDIDLLFAEALTSYFNSGANLFLKCTQTNINKLNASILEATFYEFEDSLKRGGLSIFSGNFLKDQTLLFEDMGISPGREADDALAIFLLDYWNEEISNTFYDFFYLWLNLSFNRYLRSLNIRGQFIDISKIIKL